VQCPCINDPPADRSSGRGLSAHSHCVPSRYIHFVYFTNCRYEARGTTCATGVLSACVVKGLPTARDYAYKHTNVTAGEKAERDGRPRTTVKRLK
jgi:hypothetical protein